MNEQTSKEILKKVRQIEIKTNRLVTETFAGHYHSVFKGQGISFEEVREYIPGDDVRMIDWNVTARMDKVFVKKFSEERELTILLIIDASASGIFGSSNISKRELMAEIGSLIAFSAVKNNDKVGLILFTDDVELYIPPAKGRLHILRVIREILFFQPQGKKTNIPAAMDFVNQVLKRKSVAFLISDFCIPSDLDKNLEKLRMKFQITSKRHDLIAMAVNDPREEYLPDIGILTIEDIETSEQIEIDTSDKQVRKAFSEFVFKRKKELKKSIFLSGVDYLELMTDKPYLPALLGFFKSRERRINK
ncbi:MAG: DUF58 domain-containing protein [Desulfobacterales bacterium]|nr:DUF58 domain-containing protein [Desulfobacterales bacterium]